MGTLLRHDPDTTETYFFSLFFSEKLDAFFPPTPTRHQDHKNPSVLARKVEIESGMTGC